MDDLTWVITIPDRCVCSWVAPGGVKGWFLGKRNLLCQSDYHGEEVSTLGKHDNDKPADSKDSKSGGAHEKPASK